MFLMRYILISKGFHEQMHQDVLNVSLQNQTKNHNQRRFVCFYINWGHAKSQHSGTLQQKYKTHQNNSIFTPKICVKTTRIQQVPTSLSSRAHIHAHLFKLLYASGLFYYKDNQRNLNLEVQFMKLNQFCEYSGAKTAESKIYY